MSSLNLAHPPNDNSVNGREVEIRGVIKSGEPRVLTNIYREDTNIVVWQRKLSGTLIALVTVPCIRDTSPIVAVVPFFIYFKTSFLC